MVILITYKHASGETQTDTYENESQVPWEGVYAARYAMAREGGTVTISSGEQTPQAEAGRAYAEYSYKQQVYNELKPLITDEQGTLRQPQNEAERIALERAKRAGIIRTETVTEQVPITTYTTQKVPTEQETISGMSYWKTSQPEIGAGVGYYYGSEGTGVVTLYDQNKMILTSNAPPQYEGTFTASNIEQERAKEYALLGKMPDIIQQGYTPTEYDFQQDALLSNAIVGAEFVKGTARILWQTPEMLVQFPSFVYTAVTRPVETVAAIGEEAKYFGYRLRTETPAAAGEVFGYYVAGRLIGAVTEKAIGKITKRGEPKYTYEYDKSKVIDYGKYDVSLTLGKAISTRKASILERLLGKGKTITTEAELSIQGISVTQEQVTSASYLIKIKPLEKTSMNVYYGMTKTITRQSGENYISATKGIVRTETRPVKKFYSVDLTKKIASAETPTQIVRIGGKFFPVNEFKAYASKGITFTSPEAPKTIRRGITGVYKYAGEPPEKPIFKMTTDTKSLKPFNEPTETQKIMDILPKPYEEKIISKSPVQLKSADVATSAQTPAQGALGNVLKRAGEISVQDAIKPANIPKITVPLSATYAAMIGVFETRKPNIKVDIKPASIVAKAKKMQTPGMKQSIAYNTKITEITGIDTKITEKQILKTPQAPRITTPTITSTVITPKSFITPLSPPGFLPLMAGNAFGSAKSKPIKSDIDTFIPSEYTANIAGLVTGSKRKRKSIFSGLEFRGWK